ncbi:hypothetical protein D9757_008715 [Collybiopsis confluens]|uniref:Uncharacterized protein n=1 Tax=Collybiopsis confluens TaxID=2823264 RepID=A0A8H5M379_9AGAR|nr:hypothetical protein D9757_008715 [Collybiopsis confluens]
MNKAELINIAFALKIAHEGALKDDLVARLHAHFEANSDLKKLPRYIGLFERSRKRKDPPKENNNDDPFTRRVRPRTSPTPGPSHRPPSPEPPHHSPFHLSALYSTRRFGLERPMQPNGASFSRFNVAQFHYPPPSSFAPQYPQYLTYPRISSTDHPVPVQYHPLPHPPPRISSLNPDVPYSSES